MVASGDGGRDSRRAEGGVVAPPKLDDIGSPVEEAVDRHYQLYFIKKNCHKF